MANHRPLRLQWAHEHRAWQTDWHQVVFSDELRFSLWDHDSRVPVRCMLANAAFQSALSNDIVAEHPELWSAVRFRIMVNPIYYELRVISIPTSMSVTTAQSFPSFKASLKLSFSRIMHAHMLQRLFEISVQFIACNFFFLACLFAAQIQKTNFSCTYKQYGIHFHKLLDSKSC